MGHDIVSIVRRLQRDAVLNDWLGVRPVAQSLARAGGATRAPTEGDYLWAYSIFWCASFVYVLAPALSIDMNQALSSKAYSSCSPCTGIS